MSLLVWLPLTQDLRNNGIDNSTFSIVSSNTTVNNSGKLGKCYNNNSHSGGGLISNKTIDLGQNQSMFCWFKFTDLEASSSLGGGLVSQHRYGSNSGMGITIKYVSSTTGYLSVNTGTGSSRTYNTYTGTTLLQANTWYHGGYTYDGSILKIYVNGICEKTQAISGMSVPTDYITVFCWSLTSGAGIHGDYKFYGDINDVRVYDHALSEKEVKELSKGLVAHYPLNGGRGGMDNLIDYSKVTQANFTTLVNRGKGSWNKLSLVTKDGYDCYLYDKSLSSTAFASGAWYSLMKANTTYTYSAWIYFTASANFNFTSLGHFQVYNSNSTASDKSHEDIVANRIYEPSIIPANKWTKIRITFTTNDLANSYFQIYPRYNIGANVGDLYFRDCKLEESNYPTSWTPNLVDPEYNIMGLSDIIEYDTSGNGYNGTKSGTLTNSSNTSRNSICTTFASGSHIAATINPTGYANSYTFSWWGKYTNYSGHMMWGFANGNRLNLYMASGNFYWNTGDGSNNPFNVSAATYGDGNWHHFAISGDGTTTKLYIDGEFKANAKTYKGVTGTSLYFNGWDSSTSYNFSGSLSDFRLYSTVLSANDIKELYQTASSIDKSGNLYGYEFVEI